jgi:hypothetical protein
MGRHVVRIKRSGDIAIIADRRLAGLTRLGPASQRRASHVLPVQWWKRLAFRILRWTFGEEGRISNWTRSWSGQWIADMGPSRGPVLGPFTQRCDAIDAEVMWLIQHRHGDQNGKDQE